MRRLFALLVASLIMAPLAAAPARSASPVAKPTLPAAAPKRPISTVGGVADTGQFLADTVVVLRVGPRVVRVSEYVDAYFASMADVRPAPDSLGRLEFLNSMVNKNVLALTALAVDRPLTFEDRTVLATHREQALSNVLYQRMVRDSAQVSDEEVRQAYEQYKFEIRFGRIVLEDLPTAERVRSQIVAGRLPWAEAVRRYSKVKDLTADGDMGFVSRANLPPGTALQAFALNTKGEISPVLHVEGKLLILQYRDRRPVSTRPFEFVRRTIRLELENDRAGVRADRMLSALARQIGMTYDTTNIVWASSRFGPPPVPRREEGVLTLDVSGSAPEFSDADHTRVLARHRDGQLTLGDFLHRYMEVSPLFRPSVDNLDAMRRQIDAMVLSPHMARLALERGLDRDPLAVTILGNRREQLLVEHLFQDSVESAVRVTPSDVRDYYDKHIASFITYPRVRFAAITRTTAGAADSLARRLRHGEKAADILRADSLQGLATGSIQERRENEPGPYHKQLFGMLGGGQVTVEGPDRDGVWVVIQSLLYDSGRQLSFDEARGYAEESARNQRSEELLKALINRLKGRYAIEAHPELVMRIRLVDPFLN